MSELRRERRLRFGSIEMSVAVPESTAERITKSLPYRRILRPALGLVARTAGSQSGPRGDVPDASTQRAALGEPTSSVDPKARELIERISPIEWYHSIDLGHGVVTPGFVDHRDQLPYYGLPASLEGMRCLDVATYDGFWAFEMERRGAEETVALDVASWADCDIPRVILDEVVALGANRPTGDGFRIAHEALGSKVRREISNVYDLSPERFGTFDLVFLSDLLLHLRDPQRALERVFSVCRGSVIIGDVYNPLLERYGDLCLTQFCVEISSETWWSPNVNTLKRMLTVAGFEPVEELSRFTLKASAARPIHKVVLKGTVPVRHSWKSLVANGNQTETDPIPVQQSA